MSTITTKDGTEIYYKDWGNGQPIVFSHGWPLSADDWDEQMMFFLKHGYRVIAHDRRGHGRSSQTGDGHDMDHYADDLAAVTAHLNLKNAIHVGHSTGGGEVTHYLARHGESRVGQGRAHQRGAAADGQDGGESRRPSQRSVRWISGAARGQPGAVLSGPAGRAILWLQPAGRESLRGVIRNWWRQGMMGGAKAHYDGIVAFSQTDFTEDLKKFTVPTLVMHGDDDQIVPYADSGPLSAKLVKDADAENLQGFPARHAHHASGHDQRRPTDILQRCCDCCIVLITSFTE